VPQTYPISSKRFTRAEDHETPPIWLDEHGQRRPTLPCPKCGTDSVEHRYRFEHLRMTGWGQPRQVVKIVNWCGHSQDFIPWPEADGYWVLVPVVSEAA
jgi:hypothetical protein